MALSCRHAAMNLLARREHSRGELFNKLKLRDYDANEIAQTLDDLESDGLLDDERYAEAYVRMRAQKGFGPVRIKLELNERGVDGSVVERFIRDAETSWTNVAMQAYEKKYAGLPIDDFKERAKRARFLTSRGFAFDTISRVINECDD